MNDELRSIIFQYATDHDIGILELESYLTDILEELDYKLWEIDNND